MTASEMTFSTRHLLNDKNSLRWRENIGEVALYVKAEMSTTYAVLRLGYGGGVVRGAKRGEGHLYSDGIYWALRLFWLNLDKGLRWLP